MDIKRNLYAALLIFLVFLSIPVYLDFIGVEQGPMDSEPSSNYALQYDSDKVLDKERDITTASIKTNVNLLDSIVVTTDFYKMVLSKAGGGSVVFYQIKEKNDDGSLKHVGSYGSSHLYNPELAVVLVDNKNRDHFCSPCLNIDAEETHWVYEGSASEIYVPPGSMHELNFRVAGSKGLKGWKTITLSGEGFSFETDYGYSEANNKSMEIVWDSGLLPTERGNSDVFESHSRAYVLTGGDLESITQSNIENVESVDFNSASDWVAIRNKYFGLVVIPSNSSDLVTLSSIDASANGVTYEGREVSPVYSFSIKENIQASQTFSGSYTTFIGPLDIDHISRLGAGVDQIMNFGWSIIKPFSRFILWLCKALNSTLGVNYGFVIIIISLLMRIVMGPLTKKSAESAAKMQTIAPLQKKIQEKFKDNPQKLQQEMSKLWKKHNYNPISGCLPMFLQTPILMSFFIVFRSTVEFRGEPFLFWIKDLSQPDYVFSLPFNIPMYGDAVAILPILMGISMFLTMSTTMQDSSQKTMMYFMNGFFVLIFNTFPSGLTLYYTIFNFLSYQQQLSIKKSK